MRLSLLIVVLAIFNECYSQNLIPNGTFNDVNICTEYSAPCAPSAWKTTSPLLAQFQNTDSIDHYMGITVYNTSAKNIRKYLQGQLLCRLIKDKIYKFSIRVKPDKVVIESLGVLFMDTTLFYDKDILIKQKPSIVINLKNISMVRMKRREWVKIDLEYKATGKEKYIIIGNFQSDVEQRKTFLSPPKSYTDYYYNIDDISLTPKDPTELCPEYEKLKEELYNLKKRHTLHKKNIFPPIMDDDLEKRIEVDTIRLSIFLFEFNSAIFDQIQKMRLDSTLHKISKEDVEKVEILGFTDSIGSEAYNLELSIKRAEAIKQVFNEFGYPDKKTEIKGFGEYHPAAPNSDENGRKKNRRAELILKYNKKEIPKIFDKSE